MMDDLFTFAGDMARVHAQVIDRLMLPAPEPSGAQLRDKGAAKALNRAGDDWRDKCVALILNVWSGREAIAEDFRMLCEDHGLFAHHPNAWGALILHLKRQGMLRATGEWRSPKDNKSHARPTRVYEVIAR
jgi:hypothetical protein